MNKKVLLKRLKDANDFIISIAEMLNIDTDGVRYDDCQLTLDDFQEAIKNLPNELRAVNRNEQLKEFERYKCNHCGRIFKKKCVHNCNTGLRKRHQSYSIITLSEND